jgi:hypothetical protein
MMMMMMMRRRRRRRRIMLVIRIDLLFQSCTARNCTSYYYLKYASY